MKKITLFVAMLFMLNLMSQTRTYHPFPSDYSNWIYSNGMSSGGYVLNGDTLISNLHYSKLFAGNTHYAGAIRENNKIIYFIPDTTATEYQLYNFNLNLGDTILHPYGGAICSGDTAIVIHVDSVLASDGYHRRLSFNSHAIWIEGVGAYFFLLNPCNVWCISPGNPQLVCMSSNLGFIYPNGTASCILSVDKPQLLQNKITISPNPASLTARIILSPEFINATFKIYNSIGMLVMEEKISNQYIFNLNCKKLVHGIYFLHFINDQGQITMEKILID